MQMYVRIVSPQQLILCCCSACQIGFLRDILPSSMPCLYSKTSCSSWKITGSAFAYLKTTACMYICLILNLFQKVFNGAPKNTCNIKEKMKANGKIKIRRSMGQAHNVYSERYKYLLDMGHRFGQGISSN